jgi:hypothetical protein
VTENDEGKFARKLKRQGMLLEALVLFVFAWAATLVITLLRPTATASSTNVGFLQKIGSSFVTGLECFVFAYVLSRFFKQFKTGCALVILLFFAYLIWAGRHP